MVQAIRGAIVQRRNCIFGQNNRCKDNDLDSLLDFGNQKKDEKRLRGGDQFAPPIRIEE